MICVSSDVVVGRVRSHLIKVPADWFERQQILLLCGHQSRCEVPMVEIILLKLVANSAAGSPVGGRPGQIAPRRKRTSVTAQRFLSALVGAPDGLETDTG